MNSACLRIQGKFCRLANVSVATIRSSSQLALLAMLSDLTRKRHNFPPKKHNRENQMRFCASSRSTSSLPDFQVIAACGNTHVGQTANFKLNSHCLLSSLHLYSPFENGSSQLDRIATPILGRGA